MTNEKCGVYQIRCATTGKVYIGSSVKIYRRWYQHRAALKRGAHSSPHLQHAWDKYGPADFEFSVIEECEEAVLDRQEQHYLDHLLPEFNAMRWVLSQRGADPVIRVKITAGLRRRAVLITHCPLGHLYDAANTYVSPTGKRACRACNALRVAAIYTRESPAQRDARRLAVKASHERNRTARRVAQRAYAATRKTEKREYDRQRRARLKGA